MIHIYIFLNLGRCVVPTQHKSKDELVAHTKRVLNLRQRVVKIRHAISRNSDNVLNLRHAVLKLRHHCMHSDYILLHNVLILRQTHTTCISLCLIFKTWYIYINTRVS